jgi:hypothetical protein
MVWHDSASLFRRFYIEQVLGVYREVENCLHHRLSLVHVKETPTITLAAFDRKYRGI